MSVASHDRKRPGSEAAETDASAAHRSAWTGSTDPMVHGLLKGWALHTGNGPYAPQIDPYVPQRCDSEAGE
jgi:hypothetical protein